jgi:hypothetical protein
MYIHLLTLTNGELMNVNRYQPLTLEMQQSVELKNIQEKIEDTREIFDSIDDFDTEDEVKSILKIEWGSILTSHNQKYDRHPLTLKRRDDFISEMREDINHLTCLVRDRVESVTNQIMLELQNKKFELEKFMYEHNDFTLCQLRDLGY